MSNVVIRIENLFKEYRLGVLSHGTLYRDLQSWWAKLRGREDPNSKIALSHFDQPQNANQRFWALQDICLDVEQGQVLGIIGRNGAGKSTLLKILSRVTAPTKGVVKIKGRVASLLEVGTGFHPELTGRENIYLNGAILGMTKAEIKKKFDEIVEFAEIERFLDTPVKRYSSGMYVRLAFAVAAHLESEILIIDEVLAVGDYQFRKKCMDKMGKMHDIGRTVLFVSHDMAQIKTRCDTGVLLDHGRIVGIGDARKIVDLYTERCSSINEVNNPSIREKIDEILVSGPKIEEVSIVDESGRLRTQFSSSEKFEAVLKIRPYPASDKLFAAVWFLHDQSGQQIAVGASYPMDSVLFPQSVTELRCGFDPSSLIPGTYFLRFVMHIPHYDNFDDWPDAVSFEITENDTFNSGYTYPGIWSAQHYVKHKWRSHKRRSEREIDDVNAFC